MIDTTQIEINPIDLQAKIKQLEQKNKQLEHDIDKSIIEIQKQDKMLDNLRETASEVQGLRQELQNKTKLIKEHVKNYEAVILKLDNNKLLLKVERLRRIKAEKQTEHWYKDSTGNKKDYFDIVDADLI